MRCACGARLRVRQTRDTTGTGVSGVSGRQVEAWLAAHGIDDDATVTVRDRVCDGCGRVVGTAELSIEAMSKIA
jgi:hypothetical protein